VARVKGLEMKLAAGTRLTSAVIRARLKTLAAHRRQQLRAERAAL
jgi:hypothetical protein